MEHKIKTFENACAALNLNPEALPVVTGLPKKHQKAIVAHFKLVIIAEALNEGWQPDWKNWDETKYYPWFEITEDESQPSGVGFSYNDYGCGDSGTAVGSRLCFKSRDLAEYAGKQFTELYREYILLQQ